MVQNKLSKVKANAIHKYKQKEDLEYSVFILISDQEIRMNNISFFTITW